MPHMPHACLKVSHPVIPYSVVPLGDHLRGPRLTTEVTYILFCCCSHPVPDQQEGDGNSVETQCGDTARFGGRIADQIFWRASLDEV